MSSLRRTVAAAERRVNSAMNTIPDASTRRRSDSISAATSGNPAPQYTALPASQAARIGAVPYHWSAR